MLRWFLGPLTCLLPLIGTAQASGDKNAKLFHGVANVIKDKHYSQHSYDDTFASKLFARYLTWLDNDQIIFLKSDIDELKQSSLKIVDELNGGPLVFYQQVAKIYRKRIVESTAICKSILSKPLNFQKEEEWEVQPANPLNYPQNSSEQAMKWSRWLKWQAIERMAKMPLAEMGKQNAERVIRTILQQNMQKKFDESGVYSDSVFFYNYLKMVPLAADPHSQYQTETEVRQWRDGMSGIQKPACGVGMQLKEEEGYLMVKKLLAGGAARQSGRISEGDKIISVEQENGKKENIAGHTIQEVINMIIGPEGTDVMLYLKTKTGAVSPITLKRAVLNQEPEWASSCIIEKDNEKIGYLRLPMFYGGEDRSSALDVRKELKKLKAENVASIIVDLRYNPGGSLMEVSQIIGDFIPSGAVVQTKGADGTVVSMQDNDKNMVYGGPLVVMINGFTASASELFTSAMQDYNRALIIGSPSFGKGTVQSNQDIVPKIKNYNGGYIDAAPLEGQLWLTMNKFYRISGQSVQLKGVTPDVILPSFMEYQDNGRERNAPGALPYDEIPPANYTAWNFHYDLGAVQKYMAAKVNESEVFRKLKQNEALLSKMYKAPVSLQWEKYNEQLQKMDNLLKESTTLESLKTKLIVKILPDDVQQLKQDATQSTKQNLLKENIENDLMLEAATDTAIELAGQHVKG